MDNEEKGPKTQPLKKTSAVPLRKETVRVTLKATPAGAAPAPSAAAPPSPPAPSAPSTTPLETSTIVEKAELPDTTTSVPLRQETMRVTLKADTTQGAPVAPTPSVAPTPAAPATPAAAPTVPLGSTSTPSSSPAPTIPLGSAGAAPALNSPTVPLATQPLNSGGSSQPLPKATVQLAQTQQLTTPIGGASGAPTIQTISDEDTESDSLLPLILSIAALVVASVVLSVTILHAKEWKEHTKQEWAEVFSL